MTDEHEKAPEGEPTPFWLSRTVTGLPLEQQTRLMLACIAGTEPEHIEGVIVPSAGRFTISYRIGDELWTADFVCSSTNKDQET